DSTRAAYALTRSVVEELVLFVLTKISAVALVRQPQLRHVGPKLPVLSRREPRGIEPELGPKLAERDGSRLPRAVQPPRRPNVPLPRRSGLALQVPGLLEIPKRRF